MNLLERTFKVMTTKNTVSQTAIQAAVLAAGVPSAQAIAQIAQILCRAGVAE